MVKVAIIGSGPAGYSAALYAARAGLKPLLLEGIQPGGQLMITTDVENYPGFAETIQGPWLMKQMAAQIARFDVEIYQDAATSIDLSRRPFAISTQKSGQIMAQTLIFATGAQARWLGLPEEEKLQGFGVSACATCDGFFYRNQHVAVVGGGNTAAEEALYLTKHASKVTLIHRRDQLRAEHALQQQLFAEDKIDILWNQQVIAYQHDTTPVGMPKLTGVTLRDTHNGTEGKLALDGLFIAIGHDPSTALVKDQVEMDAHGYIQIEGFSTRTNIPGFFAAGDVADPVYRQAVTAAGMGCMAALDAARFLTTQ